MEAAWFSDGKQKTAFLSTVSSKCQIRAFGLGCVRRLDFQRWLFEVLIGVHDKKKLSASCRGAPGQEELQRSPWSGAAEVTLVRSACSSQRDPVLFPAPAWQLTVTYHSSSGKSDTLFQLLWSPDKHTVCLLPCRQILTHMQNFFSLPFLFHVHWIGILPAFMSLWGCGIP